MPSINVGNKNGDKNYMKNIKIEKNPKVKIGYSGK